MGKQIKYEDIPEAGVVIKYVMERYMMGLYTLALVIGLPGTGKSSTCIRLSELILYLMNKLREKQGLEPIEKIAIIKSQLEFVEWLMQAQPGEPCVIEELSVLFPSRRAMAAANVDAGQMLDTCRKKKVIIFSNAPVMKSIDSHLRAMAHLCIETLRINKTQKVVVSKAHKLQTNPGSGKTYYHKFNDGGYDVDFIYTKMPQESRWVAYEEEKDNMMRELYEKIRAKHHKKKEKERKELGLE